MKRFLLVAAAIAAATPVAAQAPGTNANPLVVKVKGQVQADVTGAVDAHITNTIDASGLIKKIVSGAGSGAGLAIGFDLPPGRLHAASLSIYSTVAGEQCNAFGVITLYGAVTGERTTGLSLMSFGDAETVALTYPTPIELSFDPSNASATMSATISSTALCRVLLTAMYEPAETPQ